MYFSFNEEGRFDGESKLIDDVHICTESELKKLYPVKKSSKNRFKYIKSKLMSFDHSNLEISGGSNSFASSKLAIFFKIPKAECRYGPYDSEFVTSSDFEERLASIAIVTLTNRMRFDQ